MFKVIGIRLMAPVLNTGTPEGICARNVKFFGKERNYNSLVVTLLSKVVENEFLQIL